MRKNILPPLSSVKSGHDLINIFFRLSTEQLIFRAVIQLLTFFTNLQSSSLITFLLVSGLSTGGGGGGGRGECLVTLELTVITFWSPLPLPGAIKDDFWQFLLFLFASSNVGTSINLRFSLSGESANINALPPFGHLTYNWVRMSFSVTGTGSSSIDEDNWW